MEINVGKSRNVLNDVSDTRACDNFGRCRENLQNFRNVGQTTLNIYPTSTPDCHLDRWFFPCKRGLYKLDTLTPIIPTTQLFRKVERRKSVVSK